MSRLFAFFFSSLIFLGPKNLGYTDPHAENEIKILSSEQIPHGILVGQKNLEISGYLQLTCKRSLLFAAGVAGQAIQQAWLRHG